MSRTAAPGEKLNIRVLFGSLIGSVIEWFDFLIYGSLTAIVFNRIFFVSGDPFVATMLAYTSFALTFFARPLGGIIFSHFGDRIGRKWTLFLTMMLMGGGTVAIGLLPDYHAIGVAAPILLMVLRILQGIGIGGEWGGALLLAFEYAPKRQRGLYGAVPQMGISLGMLLASIVAFFILMLPEEALLSWGWRLPFLGSVLLVFVGIWVRRSLDETPEFQRARETGAVLKMPLKEVVTKHWRAVLVSIGVKACETGPFYIFGTYIVAYATDFLGARESVVMAAVAVAALIATVWMPFFGALSDRVGRKPLYVIVAVATAAYAVPYYLILHMGGTLAIFVATAIGFGLLWGSVNAILGTMIAENFAPKVRYTGATLGYQIGAAIFGGTAPLIAATLIERSGGAWWPIACYVAACAVIGLIALAGIRSLAQHGDAYREQDAEVAAA